MSRNHVHPRWRAATAALGLLALAAWRGGGDGATLQVYSRGQLVAELPLDRNGEYRVQGALGQSVIHIHDGAGMLIESPCPNGFCLHHGLRRSGQVTACLPNQLLLAVAGSRHGPGVIDGWAF